MPLTTAPAVSAALHFDAALRSFPDLPFQFGDQDSCGDLLIGLLPYWATNSKKVRNETVLKICVHLRSSAVKICVFSALFHEN